jgi:aryl carrier-like protein
MRQAVADTIGTEPAAIDDDDDLIGRGIDSIAIMRLAARWRPNGVPLKFAELVEKPSLRPGGRWPRNAWRRRRRPADRVDVDDAAPFELAAMQQAYWIGATRARSWVGSARTSTPSSTVAAWTRAGWSRRSARSCAGTACCGRASATTVASRSSRAAVGRA